MQTKPTFKLTTHLFLLRKPFVYRIQNIVHLTAYTLYLAFTYYVPWGKPDNLGWDCPITIDQGGATRLVRAVRRIPSSRTPREYNRNASSRKTHSLYVVGGKSSASALLRCNIIVHIARKPFVGFVNIRQIQNVLLARIVQEQLGLGVTFINNHIFAIRGLAKCSSIRKARENYKQPHRTPRWAISRWVKSCTTGAKGCSEYRIYRRKTE